MIKAVNVIQGKLNPGLGGYNRWVGIACQLETITRDQTCPNLLFAACRCISRNPPRPLGSSDIPARSRTSLGGYYHQRLRDVFKASTYPTARRILEIGSGSGNLLAGLAPSFGVGVDFSCEAVKQAHIDHPECYFVLADGHSLPLNGSFDVIILSDLLNDVFDVQGILVEVRRLCHPDTRILINSYSRVWQYPLWLAEMTGRCQSQPAPKLADPRGHPQSDQPVRPGS